MSSSIALLVNLAAVGVYGYAAYYMNYNPTIKKMHDIVPQPLKPYGQWKFLTYQCLILQLISAILHVGAHFSRSLQKPRDIFFTCLAYPIGSIVVYTFWAVWFFMGREFIFPVALSKFYPDWLNHVTHTIIVPINILLIIILHHKFPRNGVILTVAYTGIYTLFLHYIKMQTGVFVYKYLEAMSDLERLVYFACTGLFSFLMYKSGQLLDRFFHGAGQQQQQQQQQKQKSKQK